jgi:hypothetical protein
VPNKKNMASRYAAAHSRRDSRRRPDARVPALSGPVDLAAPPDGGASLEQGSAAPALESRMALSAGAVAARPIAPRPVAVPRSDRLPVARPAGAAGRPLAVRATPGRPVSALATTVDYSYLRGDLRRIMLLSISLFILLILLNLLLNH